MKLHDILDDHAAIAWDMDETLVKGPNSEFFRAYIAMTPHKKHYIVTFRTEQEAATIYAELESYGLKGAANLFEKIVACPTHIRDCYSIKNRYDDREARQRMLNVHPTFTRDEFMSHASGMTEFKGKSAKEHGCTILVDDLPAMVKEGCDMHSVAFLHSHDVIKLIV